MVNKIKSNRGVCNVKTYNKVGSTNDYSRSYKENKRIKESYIEDTPHAVTVSFNLVCNGTYSSSEIQSLIYSLESDFNECGLSIMSNVDTENADYLYTEDELNERLECVGII